MSLEHICTAPQNKFQPNFHTLLQIQLQKNKRLNRKKGFRVKNLFKPLLIPLLKIT